MPPCTTGQVLSYRAKREILHFQLHAKKDFSPESTLSRQKRLEMIVAARSSTGQAKWVLLGGSQRGIVIGMLADAANVLDVFELVIGADDEHGPREHAIERAP